MSLPHVPLNHLALPGLAFDLNDRIVAWNDAAARLYGLSPSEAIGLSVLLFISHDALDDFRAAVELVKQFGTWRGELYTLTASHELRLVETAWSYVSEESGLAFIVALHTDVTETRQAQEIESQRAVLDAVVHLLSEANRLSDVSPDMRSLFEFFLDQPDASERIMYAGGGRTVLWVCDDQPRREWYRLLLECYNYHVMATAHGPAFQRMIRDRSRPIHAAIVTPSESPDIVADIWRVRPLLPIIALDSGHFFAEPVAEHPVTVVRTNITARGLLSIVSMSLTETPSN